MPPAVLLFELARQRGFGLAERVGEAEGEVDDHRLPLEAREERPDALLRLAPVAGQAESVERLSGEGPRGRELRRVEAHRLEERASRRLDVGAVADALRVGVSLLPVDVRARIDPRAEQEDGPAVLPEAAPLDRRARPGVRDDGRLVLERRPEGLLGRGRRLGGGFVRLREDAQRDVVEERLARRAPAVGAVELHEKQRGILGDEERRPQLLPVRRKRGAGPVACGDEPAGLRAAPEADADGLRPRRGDLLRPGRDLDALSAQLRELVPGDDVAERLVRLRRAVVAQMERTRAGAPLVRGALHRRERILRHRPAPRRRRRQSGCLVPRLERPALEEVARVRRGTRRIRGVRGGAEKKQRKDAIHGANYRRTPPFSATFRVCPSLRAFQRDGLIAGRMDRDDGTTGRQDDEKSSPAAFGTRGTNARQPVGLSSCRPAPGGAGRTARFWTGLRDWQDGRDGSCQS